MTETKTITNKDVVLPKIVFLPIETPKLDEEDLSLERFAIEEYLRFEDLP